MLLITRHIVKQEKALHLVSSEIFKNIDHIIDLGEKFHGIEESFAILSRLEYDPGFPGRCEDVR